MKSYTVVIFKKSELSLDALIHDNERLEHVSHKSYTDIAEAYENLKIAQSEGNEAILLSDSLITDLFTNTVKKKVHRVLSIA